MVLNKGGVLIDYAPEEYFKSFLKDGRYATLQKNQNIL